MQIDHYVFPDRYAASYSNYLLTSDMLVLFSELFGEYPFINEKYGIWLLGYDGEIKDYSQDDKILLRLFNLIDSMPMRKTEIKKDNC